MIRNKKGITLIALVITIIVLLILAGVSLSLVMGDAGILKKAEFATNQTKIEGLKERIQLEIAGSYDNNGRIQLEILKENLKNNLGATNVEGNEYPLKAELEGYFFEITEDLKVIAKIGIEIEQERITFLGGSALSQTVTAKRLNNEEGTITWSTTGNIKLSATEGDSVEVSLGSETQIGDTATITATLGEYSDTIQVKFIDRMNVGDLDMIFNTSKGGTITENNGEYTLTGTCWLETRVVSSKNFKIEFDWKQPTSFTPYAYLINTGYTGAFENGRRRKTSYLE